MALVDMIYFDPMWMATQILAYACIIGIIIYQTCIKKKNKGENK